MTCCCAQFGCVSCSCRLLPRPWMSWPRSWLILSASASIWKRMSQVLMTVEVAFRLNTQLTPRWADSDARETPMYPPMRSIVFATFQPPSEECRSLMMSLRRSQTSWGGIGSLTACLCSSRMSLCSSSVGPSAFRNRANSSSQHLPQPCRTHPLLLLGWLEG